MSSDDIVAGTSQYMEDHPLDDEFRKRLKKVIWSDAPTICWGNKVNRRIKEIEHSSSDFIKDTGDYTIAKRDLYDDLTVDEVFESASNYMREHPLSQETQTRLDAYKEMHRGG